jgi:hypothetical protein
MGGRGGLGALTRRLCPVSRSSCFFSGVRADLGRPFSVSLEAPLASAAFACEGDCEDRALSSLPADESKFGSPAVESELVFPAVGSELVLPVVESGAAFPAVEFEFVFPADEFELVGGGFPPLF